MNEKLYKINLINFASSLLMASSLPLFIFYDKLFGALFMTFIGLFISLMMLFVYLKTSVSADQYERAHSYIMLRTAIRQSRIMLISYGIVACLIAALWYSHVSIRLVGSIGDSLWFQWKCLFLAPLFLAGLVGFSSSLRTYCELKLDALPNPQNDLKISFIFAGLVSSVFPLPALFLILLGRTLPAKVVESFYSLEYQQLSLDLK